MKKQFITIVCLILGTAAILGFRSGYNAQNILNVIRAECNCMQVSQNDSLHGLTYSKESGMNLGNTYTFTLQNCTFDTFEKDIDRLANKLTKELSNFCDDDILILHFEDKTVSSKKVIIKDCEWTTK